MERLDPATRYHALVTRDARFGVSPIAMAHTRRVLFAKLLIHDSRLPMAEIAKAAGFGSVRRFNETFDSCSGGRRARCATTRWWRCRGARCRWRW